MSTHVQLLAEWTPQDGVLLAWPHAQSDWGDILPRIEQVYRELVFHIARHEDVVVLGNTPALLESVREQLNARGVDLQRVHLLHVVYNDTWMRDSGPISVAEQAQVRLCDFRFNGWGGKFDASLDDRICHALSQQPVFKAAYQAYEMILEGGSIDSDGAGTLITTSQCLLTDTRNPDMHVADYETLFAREFGIQRVFWLHHGELQGDDTDGHVDMLARFCDSQTIAYTSCERRDDPHFAGLAAMEAELKSLRTVEGKAYKLLPLPIPKAIHSADGRRLPASYANFLIINAAVLVPVYADENDALVLQRLRSAFPGREVIGIDARAIIEQSGSLHCLTMQLPKGVLALAR